MKNLVILFDPGHIGNPTSVKRQFDKVFDGKSAYQNSLAWGVKLYESQENEPIVVFAHEDNVAEIENQAKEENISIKVVVYGQWKTKDLCEAISNELSIAKATTAIFSWLDCPFLDASLSVKMHKNHIQYAAEYTFAEGYPYGFTPEIIDSGASSIISSLSKDTQKVEGEKNITRESIFNIMKGDINSFEIETEISPDDFRLLRLDFSCSTKSNMLACQKLFEMANGEKSALELSKLASNTAGILRTVPSFYNIQIESKYRSKCIYSPYPEALEKTNKVLSEMSFEAFQGLVKQIAEYSENAVISLSLFGEPLFHKDFKLFVLEVLKYQGLSVVIETTGENIQESDIKEIADFANEIKDRTNGYDKVMWIVYVDSMTKEKYEQIHFVDGLSKAKDCITLLTKYFPSSTYAQFTRMNQNEDELESFYRFWSDKKSPSNGNFIIQKYNDFGGLLPPNKPADLSPLERFPDWHLRRDMVILCDGSVPLYKESMLDDTIGNVFNDSVESLWRKSDKLMEDQINKKYDEISGKCDEYYTFNF